MLPRSNSDISDKESMANKIKKSIARRKNDKKQEEELRKITNSIRFEIKTLIFYLLSIISTYLFLVIKGIKVLKDC